MINKDKIEYKTIIKNKKNQNKSMDNISNGYNKIKKIIDQINKGCFQIKNKENKLCVINFEFVCFFKFNGWLLRLNIHILI